MTSNIFLRSIPTLNSSEIFRLCPKFNVQIFLCPNLFEIYRRKKNLTKKCAFAEQFEKITIFSLIFFEKEIKTGYKEEEKIVDIYRNIQSYFVS